MKFLRLETTKVNIRFTVYIHAGQNAQTRAGFQVIKLLQAHHPQINEAESQQGEILSEGPILQLNSKLLENSKLALMCCSDELRGWVSNNSP